MSTIWLGDTPLDNVLAARGGGTPSTTETRIWISDQPLENRYARLADGLPPSATRVVVGDNDLNQIFASSGTIFDPLEVNWTSDSFVVSRIWSEGSPTMRVNQSFQNAASGNAGNNDRLIITGGAPGTRQIVYSIQSQSGGISRVVDWGPNNNDLRAYTDLGPIGQNQLINVVLRATVTAGNESSSAEATFRFRFVNQETIEPWEGMIV